MEKLTSSVSKLKQILPQIPTEKLATYSKCPKKYEYLEQGKGLHSKSLLPKTQLLQDLICAAYLKSTRETRTNPWRRITAEIDKFIFKDLLPRDNPLYDEDIDIKYKKSIDHIRSIQKTWYDPIFLKEDLDGFPHLKCAFSIENFQLVDTIDLVLFNETEMILCKFTNIELSSLAMYNDIRLRVQAFLIEKNLGKKVTKIRTFYWEENTERISIKDIRIHNPISFNNKTERSINHMISGISSKIFYPSVNEQCNSCPFNSICSF